MPEEELEYVFCEKGWLRVAEVFVDPSRRGVCRFRPLMKKKKKKSAVFDGGPVREDCGLLKYLSFFAVVGVAQLVPGDTRSAGEREGCIVGTSSSRFPVMRRTCLK